VNILGSTVKGQEACGWDLDRESADIKMERLPRCPWWHLDFHPMVIIIPVYHLSWWLQLGYVCHLLTFEPIISQVAYYYYCTFHKKPHCQRHTSNPIDLVWWWLNGLKSHFTKSLPETSALSLGAWAGCPVSHVTILSEAAHQPPSCLTSALPFNALWAGRGPGWRASTSLTSSFLLLLAWWPGYVV